MSKKFYLTTPIYYVNDRPHIGHASTTVWADVQARYRRLCGEKAFFLTGLDEHGLKVQQAALKRGVPAQQHCDEMTLHFKNLWTALGIRYDDFIRTTEDRHKKVVQKIMSDLYQKGEIYKKKYRGWYSKSAEQFVTEKEMVDGKFPTHYGEVFELEEENYFFRMSQHQDWLKDYIQKNPDWIQPENRKNEVLGLLQKPLEDLCVSRPANRLAWGIPVPFDPDYVTYVWFDALINYTSAVGYGEDRFSEYWPVDYHLIAKDILTPHAVYWTTMLHAVGIPQPKHILAHGWWLMSREKMSKSVGNVINPHDYIQRFGADALRYFICRELQVSSDTDFTEERFLQRFNADLANDLGNLVNRSISMLKRYREGVLPKVGEMTDLELDLARVRDETLKSYHQAMTRLSYAVALESVWQLIRRTNRYVDETAPWKLAKDSSNAERLDTVMNHLLQVVGGLTHLLLPVMPTVAGQMAEQLSAPHLLETGIDVHQPISAGHKVGDPSPLFPRQVVEKKGV